MKDVVNIICLYWVGEFRGRDFTPDDVVRLRQSVERYIDRPFKFYALTNDVNAVIPAEKIILKHDWPGWWAKMELHRPDLPKGRTLYLDLDSHIINSLGPILDYPGDLVMFDTKANKYKRETSKRSTDGKIFIHKYQAATMLFDPGSMVGMYDKFKMNAEKYMKLYRSDQDVMGEWIPDQPTFPKEWMIKLGSFKRQVKKLSEDIIIVTGQPKGESFRNPKFAPWLAELAR